MSYKWEKIFRHFFSSIFLPKKPSLKKILTPILSENVAYETLVYYTKPWTLYLVLVLRNRGSNIKKTVKNSVFSKVLFKKTMKPNFFRIFFFDENVAQELAQLLAAKKVFRISFQFWGKSVTNYEKLWNFSNFFFIPLFAQKKPEQKKFDVIIGFKRSLLSPSTNYETMDCVFVLGLEI